MFDAVYQRIEKISRPLQKIQLSKVPPFKGGKAKDVHAEAWMLYGIAKSLIAHQSYLKEPKSYLIWLASYVGCFEFQGDQAFQSIKTLWAEIAAASNGSIPAEPDEDYFTTLLVAEDSPLSSKRFIAGMGQIKDAFDLWGYTKSLSLSV